MLILTRREQETVCFPGLDITVKVAKCGAGTVRLGIDAPRQIRVVRGELAPLAPAAEAKWQMRSGTLASPAESPQTHLEQVQLALRLAENQLLHQRTEHAQEALQQALTELEQLECLLAQVSGSPALVREPADSYQRAPTSPRSAGWANDPSPEEAFQRHSPALAISMEGS